MVNIEGLHQISVQDDKHLRHPTKFGYPVFLVSDFSFHPKAVSLPLTGTNFPSTSRLQKNQVWGHCISCFGIEHPLVHIGPLLKLISTKWIAWGSIPHPSK